MDAEITKLKNAIKEHDFKSKVIEGNEKENSRRKEGAYSGIKEKYQEDLWEFPARDQSKEMTITQTTHTLGGTRGQRTRVYPEAEEERQRL